MDMTASTEARSDQINAADLISGPRTYTIEKVVKGVASHPFDFHLIESPGKAYRPNLSMRRVIVAAWGAETTNYTGRRLTLFNEPTVIYAGAEVGGIRVSHMSHIDKPLKTALALSQKKKVPYIVEPLIEDAPASKSEQYPEPTAEDVAACSDHDQLGGMWRASGPERRKQIEARVAELTAKTDAPADDHDNAQWDSPADSLPTDGEVQG